MSETNADTSASDLSGKKKTPQTSSNINRVQFRYVPPSFQLGQSPPLSQGCIAFLSKKSSQTWPWTTGMRLHVVMLIDNLKSACFASFPTCVHPTHVLLLQLFQLSCGYFSPSQFNLISFPFLFDVRTASFPL